jgi:hypothetical protein
MQSENKKPEKSLFPINCYYCTYYGIVKGKLNLEVVNSLFYVLMFIPKENDAKN